MKSKYRKYNNGGPVKPKKRREKVYTDKGLYEKALKSYQDSIALNNYYNLQQEVEPQSSEQNKAAFDAMQDLVMSGGRDTSRVNELRTFGDRIIDESDGSIQWAGNRKDSYSPDLQYYSIQDDPDKGMLSKVFDKLSTNTMSPLINKASEYWLGNAYNAVWDEPSVEPVYLRPDGMKEMPPRTLQLKSTPVQSSPVKATIQKRRELNREDGNWLGEGINPKVDSLYFTPGALSKYQDRFMDRMLRAAVPADTTYYDPNLGATVSAGIYDPSESNGDYSYFKVFTDPQQKQLARPEERMLELPPKLPFGNMDMSRLPALRRVLPEIYSRKLNQQTGEYIYTTSEGELRKKRGQEDADYVRMNRAAIDRMRQKLR